MTAQEIVDASISAHGGGAYDSLDISFDFRDKAYRINKEGENFRYERSFVQEGKEVLDVLENGNFRRSINDSLVQLPDTMAAKYANSVNSVCYFVLLPKPLNDPAARKELLGKVRLRGREYYKVRVTFSEEGGGEDFDDTYVYWFGSDSFQMDYLAYDFHVNGGGIRFREAYNPREYKGVRIQDYVNYKADPKLHAVEETDSLFEAGGLKELSRIETVLAGN